MTDAPNIGSARAGKHSSLLTQDDRTKKRNAAEARFRSYGVIAIGVAVIALIGLLGSILYNGSSAFRQTFITLDVYLDPAKLDKKGDRDLAKIAKVSTFGYAPLIAKSFEKEFAKPGIGVEGLKPKTAAKMISKEGPADLRRFVLANPDRIGETVTFTFLANGRIAHLTDIPLEVLIVLWHSGFPLRSWRLGTRQARSSVEVSRRWLGMSAWVV